VLPRIFSTFWRKLAMNAIGALAAYAIPRAAQISAAAEFKLLRGYTNAERL